MGKFTDLLLRMRKMYAAAHTQNRPLRLQKFTGHLADLHGMTFHRRLVCPHGHLLRILKFRNLLQLNVTRKVNQNRPRSSGSRNVKGLPYNAGKLFGVPHDIAVFDKGFHRAGNVRLLEHISADLMRIHLSGQTHHRNAVGKGRGNACDQVLGTGTAGDRYDTCLSCNPCVTAGRMCRTLLLAHQNRLNV